MVTPFDSRENVNLDAYRSNIDYYIKNGIQGLVTAGSTGEFDTFSEAEHKKVIETAVKHVNGRVPLLAGTGQCSTRRTIEISRFAQSAGADGPLIIPPFYSKPNDDEILRHYSEISDSVSIPIMVYNNPFTSKVDMKPELIAKLGKIKHVNYVKESSGDQSRIWRILNASHNKLTVFAGADNLALESFMMGAKGWICVSANVFPRECVEVYNLVREGKVESARKLYSKLLPFCNLLEETGMFAALSKAGLDLLGMKGGKTRSPKRSPSRQELEALRSIIKSVRK
jgi:4-hydroxy-tetrahydrodipicolinate synthase